MSSVQLLRPIGVASMQALLLLVPVDNALFLVGFSVCSRGLLSDRQEVETGTRQQIAAEVSGDHLRLVD